MVHHFSIRKQGHAVFLPGNNYSNSDPRTWFSNLWQQWIARNLMLVQMPSATVPPSALARKDINGSSQCVSSLQCAKKQAHRKNIDHGLPETCSELVLFHVVSSKPISEFDAIISWVWDSLSMSYVCWSSSSDLAATQRQVESDEINFNAAISACEKCQRWQHLVQTCPNDIRRHQTTSDDIFHHLSV